MSNHTSAAQAAPSSSSTTTNFKPELFDDLAQLDDRLIAQRCNLHDRGITLVTECIHRGVRSPKLIASVLTSLGFNLRHIHVLIRQGAGPAATQHLWQKDVDGNLHLHALN